MPSLCFVSSAVKMQQLSQQSVQQNKPVNAKTEDYILRLGKEKRRVFKNYFFYLSTFLGNEAFLAPLSFFLASSDV